MLKIITVPNAVLRQPSKPINNIDRKTIKFISKLGDTLIKKTNPPGVGISAVQVGKPIRVFFTLMPSPEYKGQDAWQKQNLVLNMFINPKISKTSRKVSLGDKADKPLMEGCLSIPHIWGPVWRHDWIEISYQQLDKHNQLVDKTETFNNFYARVIQHEYDHLEGILFTDYVKGSSPISSFHPLGQINELYFDEDKEFIPIKDPSKLVTW